MRLFSGLGAHYVRVLNCVGEYVLLQDHPLMGACVQGNLTRS